MKPTLTPILANLLPLVRDYGTRKARLWLEGEEELAKPDDDLCSFLARQGVEWDLLDGGDQDSLRDSYMEAVGVQRPAGSDPEAVALLREARGFLSKLNRHLHQGWKLEPGTTGHMELEQVLSRIPS
jgi:hypothetical protein